MKVPLHWAATDEEVGRKVIRNRHRAGKLNDHDASQALEAEACSYVGFYPLLAGSKPFSFAAW